MTEKLTNLRETIVKYGRVIVAFSGGVDSSFLLAVCAETLGKGNVKAVTASSEIHDESELILAGEIASNLGVEHIIINNSELNDPAFVANPPDRCYHCKKSFYNKLRSFSDDMNINVILDGSNTDDISDYRPGRKAAEEAGVNSPLMEHGFSKQDIREAAQSIKLPNWDKPANPCLASRIPYGKNITKEKLDAVAKAEAFIRNMGFGNVRVRHHDSMARIELPEEEMQRFMQCDLKAVSRYAKSLGFTWVALDIDGYRTGSLNSIFIPGKTLNNN
jgi:uncharacterized protein